MYEIRHTKWNASEKVESIDDLYGRMIKLKTKERREKKTTHDAWTKSMMQERLDDANSFNDPIPTDDYTQTRA